jgi:hypothetical protein
MNTLNADSRQLCACLPVFSTVSRDVTLLAVICVRAFLSLPAFSAEKSMEEVRCFSNSEK